MCAETYTLFLTLIPPSSPYRERKENLHCMSDGYLSDELKHEYRYSLEG